MREDDIEYHEPDSLVWIPTLPVCENDERVEFDLRPTPDGGAQLLVYSSPDALRANCGPQQTGIAVRLERVAEIAREAGASGVLFDLVTPDVRD